MLSCEYTCISKILCVEIEWLGAGGDGTLVGGVSAGFLRPYPVAAEKHSAALRLRHGPSTLYSIYSFCKNVNPLMVQVLL